MSSQTRPTVAFTLVSKDGWVVPSSTRHMAKEVREWAEENWRFEGGYKVAKKQGWRVKKVKMEAA